ncbi:Putative inositol monophosphatase 3 (IMP 3) (IMPase 3) (Inositol-1(or 4)-monophosphatase 3) (Myo-inositol monophosphatase A3), partial [Durusdinium trenchii]
EDLATVNLDTRPYTVSNLAVPERLFDEIDAMRTRVAVHSAELGQGNYADCTVFIDPIDGTREFSTHMGEHCTILFGVAIDGRPAAGLVFGPLSSPVRWALGCKHEQVWEAELDSERALPTVSTPPHPHGLLTTNGSISPFTEALLVGLGAEHGVAPDELRVKAGGVGNKVLNLLEGKGGCYIQDRGVSRWDTCAAQAVIEAKGGVLAKLSRFVEDGSFESYRYERSAANLDVDAAWPPRLTAYNSINGSLKPYANVCGLLALPSDDPAVVAKFKKLVDAARKTSAPAFD